MAVLLGNGFSCCLKKCSIHIMGCLNTRLCKWLFSLQHCKLYYSAKMLTCFHVLGTTTHFKLILCRDFVMKSILVISSLLDELQEWLCTMENYWMVSISISIHAMFVMYHKFSVICSSLFFFNQFNLFSNFCSIFYPAILQDDAGKKYWSERHGKCR